MRTTVGTGREEPVNFWKTLDDQFAIKMLVSAWNLADVIRSPLIRLPWRSLLLQATLYSFHQEVFPILPSTSE
jgi:hypothetical protein